MIINTVQSINASPSEIMKALAAYYYAAFPLEEVDGKYFMILPGYQDQEIRKEISKDHYEFIKAFEVVYKYITKENKIGNG